MGVNVYWYVLCDSPYVRCTSSFISSTLLLVFSPSRKYEDSTPFLLSTSSPIPLSPRLLWQCLTQLGQERTKPAFQSAFHAHLLFISGPFENHLLGNGVGWGNKTGRVICCQGWGGLSLRPQRLMCIKFLAQNLVHDTHSAGIAVWLSVLPLGGHKSDEWGRLTSCQPVDYSLNVWKLPRGSFSEEKLWQSGSGLINAAVYQTDEAEGKKDGLIGKERRSGTWHISSPSPWPFWLREKQLTVIT